MPLLLGAEPRIEAYLASFGVPDTTVGGRDLANHLLWNPIKNGTSSMSNGFLPSTVVSNVLMIRTKISIWLPFVGLKHPPCCEHLLGPFSRGKCSSHLSSSRFAPVTKQHPNLPTVTNYQVRRSEGRALGKPLLHNGWWGHRFGRFLHYLLHPSPPSAPQTWFPIDSWVRSLQLLPLEALSSTDWISVIQCGYHSCSPGSLYHNAPILKVT